MKNISLAFIILFVLAGTIPIQADEPKGKTITYSVGPWKPMVYLDEDGKTTGLYIEMLNALFVQELNMDLKVIVLPWIRAQKLVENGSADFMVTIPTDQRMEYAVPSEIPFYKLYLNIYTYKGHEKLGEIRKIKSVGDIKKLGLTPVSNLGNGWHKENIDAFGINTHYVPKDDNIAKVLALKRADIMIDAVVPMNYIIKTQGLSSKIELTKARFGPVVFHLFMGKKSKFIRRMPDINKSLNKLYGDGTFNRLISNYMSLD